MALSWKWKAAIEETPPLPEATDSAFAPTTFKGPISRTIPLPDGSSLKILRDDIFRSALNSVRSDRMRPQKNG